MPCPSKDVVGRAAFGQERTFISQQINDNITKYLYFAELNLSFLTL